MSLPMCPSAWKRYATVCYSRVPPVLFLVLQPHWARNFQTHSPIEDYTRAMRTEKKQVCFSARFFICSCGAHAVMSSRNTHSTTNRFLQHIRSPIRLFPRYRICCIYLTLSSHRFQPEYWKAEHPYIYLDPSRGDSWATLRQGIQKHDDERCKGWREDLETLLVFVCHFQNPLRSRGS